MKLYIVTLRGYDTLGDSIIKAFSDKDTLNKWLDYANKMELEIFGCYPDPNTPMSKRYRIKEADLDNLDWIDLYTHARDLGAKVKPSQPQ